jgi:hypothetical protein
MIHETGRLYRTFDVIFNLLFYCGHYHMTRPFTPLRQQGVPRCDTYVVCLDCAKQFAYDLTAMRVGKVINHTHEACVIPPQLAKRRGSKLGYALGVAVPVAVLAVAALKTTRPASGR